MDFDFNDEQKMLQKGARDFFEKEVPKSLVKRMAEDEKGNPPDLWKKMAQLGWLGLIFPEQYGGGGGSIIDQFGMGAEIGISTDKIHCRGPMALEELCTYKYEILGSGQTRV